jgi:hypothetical protein
MAESFRGVHKEWRPVRRLRFRRQAFNLMHLLVWEIWPVAYRQRFPLPDSDRTVRPFNTWSISKNVRPCRAALRQTCSDAS